MLRDTLRQLLRSMRLTAVMLALSSSNAATQTPKPRSPAQSPGLSVAQIAERSLPASVTIATFDAEGDTLKLGSGFVVRSDGVVVTNWHVLTGASTAVVVTQRGEVFDRVSVIDGDSIADVVLLKFPALALPTLSTSTRTPPPGTHLVVIGAPLGLTQTVSDGVLSATRMENGREMIQMSAAISPGSSGGPVIDPSGRVIGISRSSLRGGQQLNFAVPIRYALALLQSPQDGNPHPISEVFGDAASMSGDDRGQTAVEQSDKLSSEEAVSVARASISGAYSTQTLAVNPNRQKLPGDTVLMGLLVLDDAGEGWYVPNYLGHNALYAYDAVSTATGRVGMKIGRIPIEGHQTERGLRLSGRDPENGIELTFNAILTDFPLAFWSGVYDIEGYTDYRSKAYQGAPTRWTGTAAVLYASDSLHISIHLRNESGGTQSALIVTPLLNGNRFEWRNTRGTLRATGKVENGRLTFDWYDEREKGAVFYGPMKGSRR